MSRRPAQLASGDCVECGATFTYRPRGLPSVTCGPECHLERRRKMGRQRTERWARRLVARGLLADMPDINMVR